MANFIAVMITSTSSTCSYDLNDVLLCFDHPVVYVLYDVLLCLGHPVVYVAASVQ